MPESTNQQRVVDQLVRNATRLGIAKRAAETAGTHFEQSESEDLRQLAEDTSALAEDAEVTLVRTAQALNAVPRPSEDPMPSVDQTPPDPPQGDQVRPVTPGEREALGPGRDVWVKKRFRPDGRTKYYGLKPKRAYMEYDPKTGQPIGDWKFVPSSEPAPTNQVREEDTRVSSNRSPFWYILLGFAAFIIAFLAWSWIQNGGLNDLQRDLQQIDWNPLDNEDRDNRLDSAARQQLNDARKRLASLEAKDADQQEQIDDLNQEVADMKARLDSGEIVYQDEIVQLEARVDALEEHAIVVIACPPDWEDLPTEEIPLPCVLP